MIKEEYIVKSFDALTTTELYELLRLRSEVFVMGQHCLYQDMDGKDYASHHLLLYVEGKLAGCTRLLPPGLSYPEASIGRVALREAYRGHQLGKRMMERSIEACETLFKTTAIHISAQLYLLEFYKSLGFLPCCEPYDEEGIPHVGMVRGEVEHIAGAM